MCTPLLLGLAGLAVSAGGVVVSSVAADKADAAQKRVAKKALKLNTETANKNQSLLMGSAKDLAPTAASASDAVATSEAQQAANARGNDALALFEGSRGGPSAQNEAVAGKVQSAQQPRANALAVIQGNAEGARRRLQLVDRTNEQIDANTSNTGRLLGLLPGQMNLAATSGRGLALGGQLATTVGNGMATNAAWSPRPTGTGSVPAYPPGDYRAGPYANPYLVPDPNAYTQAQA